MLLQSLQERAGSLRWGRGVKGWEGEGVVLEPQPSRQSGTHCFLSLPSRHRLILSHTLGYAHTQSSSKIKTSPSDSPSILRQLFVLFFFFFLHLVSSGLVDQHAHISPGSCKRVHSGTDRSGQIRASSLQGSRGETQQQTHLWTI